MEQAGVEMQPEEALIKVIESKKQFLDFTTASPEEVENAVELQIENTPSLAYMQEALRTYVSISRILQSPLRAFIQKTNEVVPQDIIARELLYNSAIHPILASEDDKKTWRIQPAFRTRAVDNTNKNTYPTYLAQETPVNIIGLEFIPNELGELIWEVCGNKHRAIDAMLATGNAVASVMYALGIQSGYFSGPLSHQFKKQQIMFDGSQETPTKLLVSMRAVFSYMMGAAVHGTMSALEMAREGVGVEKLTELVMTHEPILSSLISNKEQNTLTFRNQFEQEQLQYLISRARSIEGLSKYVPFMYEMTDLFELYRLGIMVLYLYVLTEGREAPEIDEFFMKMKLEREKIKHREDYESSKAATEFLAKQYLRIVEDKFGAQKLKALIAKFKQKYRGQTKLYNHKLVLSLLDAREREIVKTEFANQQEMIAAMQNNKCPHIKLLKRLRTSVRILDSYNILTELSKYFNNQNDKQQWLTCRECKFRILCPHVRDRINLEAKKAPYDMIRSRLLKYANRHTESVMNSYSYYCSICSEHLADMIEEDRTAELLGKFGKLDDTLKRVIWREALQASEQIRESAPTNPKQFASAATVILYPLVLEDELASIKRGRKKPVPIDDEEEVIDPRTHLSVILYVYAYILNLIASSLTNVKTSIGFNGVSQNAKVSTYAEHILDHIVNTKKGIISQMQDITAEYIAGKFKEVYRHINGETGEMRIKPVNAEEEIAIQLTQYDPIYHYALRAARVTGHTPISRPKTPNEARREFELIVGEPLPDIVKNAREMAKDPALAPLMGKRNLVEIPAGTTLEFMYQNPKINMFTKMFRVPADRVSFVEKSSQNILADIIAPGFNSVVGGEKVPMSLNDAYWLESYRLFVDYTVSVVDKKTWDAFQQRLAKLRETEKIYRMERTLNAIKACRDFGFVKPGKYKILPLAETWLYDENGLPHEWNVFIYKTGSGGSLEVKKSEVLKFLEKNTITPEHYFDDFKCGICGITQSDLGKLDVEKTQKSILAASEIDTLFIFYESRCPEGDLHSWENSVCIKCKLRANLIQERLAKATSRLGSEARNYYDKYKSVFVQDRLLFESMEIETPQPVVVKENKFISWAKAWKKDYGIIVKAADKIKTTAFAIEAIGAMEKRDYSDILDGKGVSSPPVSFDDHRILAADSAVRTFMAHYNQLRNYSKYVKPPPYIANIVETSGVPKQNYESVTKQLPDVAENYIDKLEAIRQERNPQTMLDFEIQHLCEMALKTAELASPLAQTFAITELSNILRSEKLLSKPGSFNFAIFSDDFDTLNLDSDAVDVGEDVSEEIDANAGEDGSATYNPFSYEGMDYVPDDNIEPE